jgi:hypothetical protein
MKRLLILVMVVAMAMSGCTALKGLFSNAVVDFICNPTVEQQQTAAQMLTALDAAQVVAAGFYPVVGVFQASAVLTNIKNGGCFLVAELKKAFEAVDAANAATALSARSLMTSKPLVLPQYESLRKLVK